MTSSVGSTTGTAGTGELAGTLEATAAPPPRRPRGRGSALRRQERWAGWLFVLPGAGHADHLPGRPDRPRLLRQPHPLGRPVQPVRRRCQIHRVRQLQEPAHGRQPDPAELRHLDPQQLLLRAVRGAAADRAGAVPGRAAEQQVPQGRSYFRTAFFFPSVTSSIAITLVFLFLFSGGGAINQLLGYVGIHGPNWIGRLARGLPPGASGRSGWTRRPAGPGTSSSTCPGGTGSPGRRSPCA